MLSEVKELEHRIEQIERELTALTRPEPVVQQLRQIPGIGLLGSTAIRAAVGDVERFPSGRSLASWLGLTPVSTPAANVADSVASPSGVMSICALYWSTVRALHS
jgi:transposase